MAIAGSDERKISGVRPQLLGKGTIAVGGLNEKQDPLSIQPGEATALVNFEPSITGGYRRLTGFNKWDSLAVPGSGKVIGVVVFNSGVLAARTNAGDTATDLYHSTGSGWGAKINSDTRTKDGKHRFTRYNWTGTERTIGVDGKNNAFRWDGTTYTLLNASGAPADPKFVTTYKNHVFFAGYSSNKSEITFSAPADETNYSALDGAGTIVIGDEITNILGFRNQLIILCKNSLHRLVGGNLFEFAVLPITTNVGCIASDSVQEISGDLIFLAPDGFRTIAGTEKIGDIELGTLSDKIKPRIDDAIAKGLTNMSSVLIREKNQYRLFHPATGTTVANASGLIGGLRRLPDDSLKWEWGTTLGIAPFVSDSDFIGDDETVVHGSFTDGFVFRQEQGNSFDGANVAASCQFADELFDDPTVRKVFHRLRLFYKPEGNVSLSCKLILDFNDPDVVQPPVVVLTEGGSVDVYGTGKYGTAKYGKATTVSPKKHLIGSGFTGAVKVSSNDTNNPYTLQGYFIEFSLATRR